MGDMKFVERVTDSLGFWACGQKGHEGLHARLCVLQAPLCFYNFDSGVKNALVRRRSREELVKQLGLTPNLC